MLRYKNIGRVTKTFHGVTFKPGETREVPGYINAPTFIRVNSVVNSSNSSKVSVSNVPKIENVSKSVPKPVKQQVTPNKKTSTSVISSSVSNESKDDPSSSLKESDCSESKG